MIPTNVVINTFNVESVLKRYPKSGQKQVLLVKHKIYGKVMLKIVEGPEERVKREIEIVTVNMFNNVPKVLEVNSYDIEGEEGIYLLEEYIDGDNLRNIEKEGALSLKDGIALTKQLLEIIVQMENKHVVHRDIKPENILKSKDGKWYLIDFGIARALNLNSLTMTEVQVGPHTPGYAAPELFQYSKKDIDSRADLFSLGVVVFEALTQKHPFLKGDELNANEIWYNTITVLPKSIELEGDSDMKFMSLIQTFMQKHITRRPPTAAKALEWFCSIIDELGEF